MKLILIFNLLVITIARLLGAVGGIAFPDGTVQTTMSTNSAGIYTINGNPDCNVYYIPTNGLSYWASGIDQADDIPIRDFVTTMKGYTFWVGDGVLTNGSTTLVSTQANFNISAIGYVVAGAGIPLGAYITNVVNSTNVVLSDAATSSATGVRLEFSKVGWGVNDLEYWSHNGFGDATVGFGKPQPNEQYRVHILAGTASTAQGDLKIWTYGSQSAKVIDVGPLTDSAVSTFSVSPDGSIATAGDIRVTGSGIYVPTIQFTGNNAATDPVVYTITANPVYSGTSHTTVAKVDLVRPSNQSGNYDGEVRISARKTGGNTTEVGRFDADTTAGNTSLWLWDVDGGTLKRVSVGTNDSAGAGFKVLRVAN